MWESLLSVFLPDSTEGSWMTRRYALNSKIDALNQIDLYDGDVALVSKMLAIPARTLHRWLHKEAELRRRHRARQKRQRDRLAAELQLEMLERGKMILSRLDEERLDKAPLNQLATSLSSLIAQALKLEEAIEEVDETSEQVIRHEYFYAGAVQDAPPWTGASAGSARAFQGGRLRAALGQDRAGQNGAAGRGDVLEQADLVAGADLHDGEPGLARFEGQRQSAGRLHDQRERTPD